MYFNMRDTLRAMEQSRALGPAFCQSFTLPVVESAKPPITDIWDQRGPKDLIHRLGAKDYPHGTPAVERSLTQLLATTNQLCHHCWVENFSRWLGQNWRSKRLRTPAQRFAWATAVLDGELDLKRFTRQSGSHFGFECAERVIERARILRDAIDDPELGTAVRAHLAEIDALEAEFDWVQGPEATTRWARDVLGCGDDPRTLDDSPTLCVWQSTRFPEDNDTKLMAAVLDRHRVVAGKNVAILPRFLVDALLLSGRCFSSRYYFYSASCTDSDEVLETAAGLWDITLPENGLSDFPEVLALARTLAADRSSSSA